MTLVIKNEVTKYYLVMIENYYYKTSDLALATTLSLKYPISSIDKTNLSRSEFLFENSKTLCDFVNKYWNGELRIEPQKFFNQLKVIKTRLYS